MLIADSSSPNNAKPAVVCSCGLPNLLISFSGGRTSAYMTYFILKHLKHKYNDIQIVFANTGKEREETLEFIKKTQEHFKWNVHWVEAITNPKNGIGVRAKIVDFKTADRQGKLYEDMIAKHGIPNMTTPHCTREMKAQAIRAFARDFLKWKRKDYFTAIGYRADEPKRIDRIKQKKENLFYPLFDLHRVGKSDINKFWLKNMPFDLELKSFEGNCDLCWKKSLRKIMTMLKHKPELADWYIDMEAKYEMYVPETRANQKEKPPIRFFQEYNSIHDLLHDAQNTDFIEAIDESKEYDKFKQIDMFDEYLDTEIGCAGSSCEVF